VKIQRHSPFAFALFLLPAVALASEGEESTDLGSIQVNQGESPSGSAAAGYRSDSVQLGPLGSGSPQEIPFTIATVPGELIRNTQANNSAEALRYLPTVYVSTGASQITPYFTLRGISASTWSYNMAVDQMRSFDIYQPLEDKEGIEVLSGAAGFLYGITSPAGMIDYVSKAPSPTPLRELTLGSYDQQLHAHLDLGGPLSETGELSYRLNLAYADAGDTGVEQQGEERYLLSGALAWQIDAAHRLQWEASRSHRQLRYAQSLFMTNSSIGIPTPPSTDHNWGAPYSGADDTTTRLGVALTSELAPQTALRARYRYSDIERSYLLTRQVWQNSDLDYRWRIDAQEAFHTYVHQYQLFLDHTLASGPLLHRLTVGVSGDRYEAGNNGYHGTTYTTLYPGNLYSSPSYPEWSAPPAGTATAQQTQYSTLLLADRIELGERWSLLLAGTQARVDDTSVALRDTSRSVTHYADDAFTPALSLSFTPIPAITGYLSYAEALQQGFTAGATASNAGESFAPFVSRQQELGIKASVGDMALALAWFQLTQANQYVDPQTLRASQDGRVSYRGWELSASGRLTPRLSITGGASLLSARIDSATANIGRTPQGVAERSARLYAEYDLPAVTGLTLTGGLSYTGKVPWDAANSHYVDAVTLFDAGLRYRTRVGRTDTTWRLGLANVTGEEYWTTRSGILYLGAPRTLTLSVSAAF